MLQLTNAKERDLDDWISLFKHADSRFQFVGVRKPSESVLSFIEARWEGE